MNIPDKTPTPAQHDPTDADQSDSDRVTTEPKPHEMTLDSPVRFLPGVGPRRAGLFERLGISTVGDLLNHLPVRHEYEHAEQRIVDLGADQLTSARGRIGETRLTGRGRAARFEATLLDETGHIHLTWFRGAYLRRQLHAGMTIRVQGKTRRFAGRLQMINPKWEVIPEGADVASRGERLRPVYPATEDLPSNRIDEIVQRILPAAIVLIEDHLPPDYRAKRDLVELSEAYRIFHRPHDQTEVAEARRRFALDELLMLQLGVAMRRHQLRRNCTAPALAFTESIDKHIRDRLPFTLTPDQDCVVKEIAEDLTVSTPMNRLLQGDVGSGKTVVALYAMLMAVAARKQAALMAPTELLAEQHFSTITAMLGGSSVRIELLTGALTPADRQSLRQRLRAGAIDLIVATHALLSEVAHFESLAVVVIDEQHRFGVRQRAQLRAAPEDAADRRQIPHTLVMTATPIPRTLSLTLFGDLDVSVIRNLPPGRIPIVTKLVGPDKADTVYEYVAGRIRDNGEQAYVVLPAIDDNPASDLKAVRSHMQQLKDTQFAGLHLAAVHGRLKRETRERTMDRFRMGKIDVLIATTVIEVGVDVPNASLMVVEHAERFGLSQLHQLRGRVGRGSRRSLCTFIGDPSTDESKKRLEAIAATNDGFRIAERDFEIRGMGEIFGTRQSGFAPFRVADLPRDIELLNLARRDARKWIDDDPDLQAPEVKSLRERLMTLHGEGLGIADVG